MLLRSATIIWSSNWRSNTEQRSRSTRKIHSALRSQGMSMVPFTADTWMHIAQITNDKCTNARYVHGPIPLGQPHVSPGQHHVGWFSSISRAAYQKDRLAIPSCVNPLNVWLYTGVHVFTHTSTHYVRCPLSPNAPPAQVGAPKFPPNTFGTFPTLPSVQTSTKVALNWTNTSRQKNTHTQTNEDTDQMRHKHDYSETH